MPSPAGPCAKSFIRAGVGLSGVNLAVAETGTLCLVENEGNGRMCTTVPPVHIALMGLEKVIEKLEEVPPMLRLLIGSATGQLITTYVNMITSPRKAGEKDGPREVHLIILDNGRSKIYADAQRRQTLQCIRCGTCLNHCPVYTRIGGHAYGYIYPGPIGKILNPQIEGPGSRRNAGHRLQPVQCLRGGLSRKNSHPGSVAPDTQRNLRLGFRRHDRRTRV